MEELSAGRLVADVFGFEKIQHAQAIDGIFTGSALVDIGSQGNLSGIEPPRHQAFVAHAAVPRFVVGPARGIVDPLPGENVGEGAQHHPAVLDGPYFIEVADGGAQLQLDPFAVGINRIDHVWPVKAARPEARVACGPVGNGVGPGSGQRTRDRPRMKTARLRLRQRQKGVWQLLASRPAHSRATRGFWPARTPPTARRRRSVPPFQRARATESGE